MTFYIDYKYITNDKLMLKGKSNKFEVQMNDNLNHVMAIGK